MGTNNNESDELLHTVCSSAHAIYGQRLVNWSILYVRQQRVCFICPDGFMFALNSTLWPIVCTERQFGEMRPARTTGLGSSRKQGHRYRGTKMLCRRSPRIKTRSNIRIIDVYRNSLIEGRAWFPAQGSRFKVQGSRFKFHFQRPGGPLHAKVVNTYF